MIKIPNIDNISQVKLYIKKYLSEFEDQKQNGEVFTPEIIVCKLLEELNIAYPPLPPNIFTCPPDVPSFCILIADAVVSGFIPTVGSLTTAVYIVIPGLYPSLGSNLIPTD